IAIKPSEEGAVLISLYNEITGQSVAGGTTNAKAQTAIKLVAKELVASKGTAVVVAGANDVNIQSLVNTINTQLGAYGADIDLDDYSRQYQGSDAAFQQFLTAANGGKVGVVLFLNSNPVYNYFNSGPVYEALMKVDFTFSYADRTVES